MNLLVHTVISPVVKNKKVIPMQQIDTNIGNKRWLNVRVIDTRWLSSMNQMFTQLLDINLSDRSMFVISSEIFIL